MLAVLDMPGGFECSSLLVAVLEDTFLVPEFGALAGLLVLEPPVVQGLLGLVAFLLGRGAGHWMEALWKAAFLGLVLLVASLAPDPLGETRQI